MGPGPAGIPQLEYLFSRLVCISVPLGYIILLVILVIAGIKYLTSGGEPKAVQSAHHTISWGLLGIVFLALAWLILQLIQNFTGIEVTKFTVASLPGVEGFTGSCWESPSVSENKPTTTAIQAESVKTDFPFPVQRIMVPCDNPYDRMIPLPANPMQLTSQSGFLDVQYDLELLFFYVDNPFKDPGFKDTIEKVNTINVLGDEAFDDKIWWERPFGGIDKGIREAVIEYPSHVLIKDELARSGKGYFLAKYHKGQVPKSLILAKHGGQQVIKKIKELGGPVYLYQNETDFDTVTLLGYECSDADFYTIRVDTPLIYLYAKQPLNTNVKINSPVFSTFPNNGGTWSAQVLPEGKLIDQYFQTHQFIPYEFLRSDFKRPKDGFVVDKEHFESFLKENLWSKLGLTDQEIADYLEDLKWRIPESPYYFISLIDRSEIDRVLPMEVNPKPDTIIRNMTYILPIDKPFIPMPIKIKAPDRNGFTVLENGGFIDGF